MLLYLLTHSLANKRKDKYEEETEHETENAKKSLREEGERRKWKKFERINSDLSKSFPFWRKWDEVVFLKQKHFRTL